MQRCVCVCVCVCVCACRVSTVSTKRFSDTRRRRPFAAFALARRFNEIVRLLCSPSLVTSHRLGFSAGESTRPKRVHLLLLESLPPPPSTPTLFFWGWGWGGGVEGVPFYANEPTGRRRRHLAVDPDPIPTTTTHRPPDHRPAPDQWRCSFSLARRVRGGATGKRHTGRRASSNRSRFNWFARQVPKKESDQLKKCHGGRGRQKKRNTNSTNKMEINEIFSRRKRFIKKRNEKRSEMKITVETSDQY